MKERPILFSASMVRALLDGSKTQTRRVCKPAAALSAVVAVQDPNERGQRPPYYTPGWFGDEDGEVQFFSPYGAPGDRLYVREAYSGPHWIAGLPPCNWAEDTPIWYWADGNPGHGDWTKPKPGMHLPRWGSRILLEITGVRVERLQDISEADALAEGLSWIVRDYGKERCFGVPESSEFPGQQWAFENWSKDAVTAYRRLWESINGPGSWDANPWVWCVAFKVVKP